MLATIQVLETELENYKKRVNFLRQYIEHLTKHTTNMNGDVVYNSLDDVDKAYRLQNELDFKNVLIKQRESQIKQVQEQEQLKQKAIEEMPELIDKSKVVYDAMLDDLDKLKKAKKTKEIKDAIKMVEMQSDEVSDIIDGIEDRFNNDDYKNILNDFRQINNILKLKE
jgi:predicted XRE-type DNA-binding protein